ncbi:MAG TPA: hypothetical protein IAC03_03580 [Candidatus Coprenecus pullistercoris]|nr:hypothetical protein [Candidatus Coprenecus pullistercoris]
MAEIRKEFAKMFRRFLTDLSPELNTRYIYRKTFGRPIDLEHPRTLDEKIQWLKLHTYRNNPLVTQCADKYRVREYVEGCGCGDILNDLYGVYDDASGIDWDALPEKFVLKWNFGCGQNFICRDKSACDRTKVKAMLGRWKKARNTFYKEMSEMQYRGIPPKLICERLIETEDGLLPKDYKLYCFNGKPHCALVCANRIAAGHADYYFFDRDWNLLRYNKKGQEVPEGFTLPRPEGFDRLFEYAERLAKPFPFVRADFYLEAGKVIFGELTFTPAGGFDRGRLPSTQDLFGDMLVLPSK